MTSCEVNSQDDSSSDGQSARTDLSATHVERYSLETSINCLSISDTDGSELSCSVDRWISVGLAPSRQRRDSWIRAWTPVLPPRVVVQRSMITAVHGVCGCVVWIIQVL